MPELPEVEAARRIAERALAGRRIERVAVAPDDLVLEGGARRRIGRALTGARLVAAHRRGKHQWWELDRRPWPVFHLGMSGSFHVYRDAAARPSHWKLEVTARDGTRLAMRAPRRIARIRLRDDPPVEPPISELGFDPLLDLPPSRELGRRLAGRRSPIKSVLLDQGFSAGVGNWIADEVLHRAGIDPRRPARDLGADEVARLRASLRAVIRRAVAVDADADRFPRGWLFHRRWARTEAERAGATTAGGDPIRFDRVGGRTTVWVPARQR